MAAIKIDDQSRGESLHLLNEAQSRASECRDWGGLRGAINSGELAPEQQVVLQQAFEKKYGRGPGSALAGPMARAFFLADAGKAAETGKEPSVAPPPTQSPQEPSPALIEHFKSKGLDEKYTEAFFSILSFYGFVPRTESEIDLLTDQENIYMLTRPATRELYKFLRESLGYEFEPSFIASLRAIVSWDEMKMTLEYARSEDNMRAFASALLGRQAEKAEKRNLEKEFADAFNEFVAEFRKTFEPEDMGIIKVVLAMAGGPISLEGLRAYAMGLVREKEKWREEARSLRFDVQRLKGIGGGAYANEAFLLAVSCIAHPDILSRLEVLVGDLNPRAEGIAYESIEFISSYRTRSGFKEFVAWIAAHFNYRPTIEEIIGLSHFPEFRPLWSDEEDWLPLTDETAAQIKAFIEGNGLSFDPLQLKNYVWTPKAIDLYQKFLDAYGIEPLTNGNLQRYRNIFLDLVHESSPELVLRPDIVEATIAASESAGERQEEEGQGLVRKGRDLEDVNDCLGAILGYENKITGAAAILARLAGGGVALKYIRSGVTERTNIATLKILAANDALVAEAMELSKRLLGLGIGIELDDVSEFIGLSQSVRQALASAQMGELLALLRDRYDCELSFDNIKEFVTRSAQEGSEIGKELDLLRKKEVIDFYARNREIFFAADSPKKKLEPAKIFLILRFYSASKKRPRMLEHARLFHRSTGLDIDEHFVNDYDASFAKLLADKRFEKLTAALKGLGLKFPRYGESVANALLPHVDLLNSKKFQGFFTGACSAYNFGCSTYDLRDAIGVYKEPSLKNWLGLEKVQRSAADLASFGYKAAWGGLDELKSLGETENLIENLKEFEKTYKVSLKDEVRDTAALLNSPLMFLVGGNDDSLIGKRFNFFAEFIYIVDRGDARTLLGEDAREAYDRMSSKLGYKLSLTDIQGLLAFLKTKGIRDVILSDAFADFWERLRQHADLLKRRVSPLKFDLSYADIAADLSRNEEATFRAIEGLKSAYGYELGETGDIVFIKELVNNAPAYKILVDEGCKAIVSGLRKSRGYKFKIEDAWALIHLAIGKGGVERLYSKDVDMLASHALGRDLKNELAERFEIAELLAGEKGTEMAAFFASEDYKATKEKIGRYAHMPLDSIPASELEGVYEAHRNPEIFRFLDEVKYRRSWIPPLDHMPGLARLAKQPEAAGLVKRLEAMRHKDSGFYIFHPGDAAALAAMLEGSSPKETAMHALELMKKCKGLVSASDIYYYIQRRNSFSSDRAGLEAEIASSFPGDIHRHDSNFDSYTTYNDPTSLSLVDLNKVVELKGWLALPGTRRAIGAIIRKDIDVYPASELGGVILVGDAPAIVEGEPKTNFNNGSYRMPQGALDLLSLSLVDYHLHATDWNEAAHAGPSGSRFIAGGDLSVANALDTDGIVITSIGEKRFCAHFYDTDRNVVFLGTYEMTPAQRDQQMDGQ